MNRAFVRNILLAGTIVPFAAMATRRARPSPSSNASPLRTVQFATDVPSADMMDMERARAFQPAPGLHFEIETAPTVTSQEIRARGYLVNEDTVAHEVIVFPVGSGGFYLGFVPNRGIAPRPAPPGGPPMPPPVPPPPRRFEAPPRTRILMESTLDPRLYTYTPGAPADLEWKFYYWNPPQPAGQFHVVIP